MRPARVFAGCILVGSLAAPAAALAQEKGDTGLTMGYPTTVGFVYHVSDRLAIRPEISLVASSGKSESPLSTTEGDTFSIGVGVSGIFYLKQWDKLRTYLSPRYTYSHGESTTTSTFDSLFAEDSENTQTSKAHTFMGTFGAQYAVHERFSVFGEVGASFARQRSRSDLNDLRSTSNQFATRTAVGVILYF
jgi:hypothetical protein